MINNVPFFQNLIKNEDNYLLKDPVIDISFNFGARVEIIGYTRRIFRVEFWNEDSGILEFASELRAGHYASPSKKYYVKWTVKVFENGKLLQTKTVNLEGSTVFVYVDTSSLGDNLAFVPQIIRFSEIRKCKLIITSFNNALFSAKYPQVTWIDPGSRLIPYDYAYKIGYFYDQELYSKTPVDPRITPLGKVPCDILQIPYKEVRPELDFDILERPMEKPYVCIATESTAGAKYWHRPNGWQDVIDYLNDKGYQVAVIQKEPTRYKNILDWTGDIPLRERLNQLHHAEFFIGLGSGLSWLAWAAKKKVILISGFSDAFSEFQLDCERVINKDVCNSCWNDTLVEFDKGDWWWCPRHKDTDRYFECTREIKSDVIFEKIDKILSVKSSR